MNDEVREDLDLDLQEEVVLKRWDRMKQWWQIGSAGVTAIKYAIMGFKLLFVGSTAAVIVGQATDSEMIRDTAVEIGILDERNRDIVGNDAIYDELSNLIEDVEALEEQMALHEHEALYVPHSHDLVEHTHPPQDTTHEHAAVAAGLIAHDHDHEHALPAHEHGSAAPVSQTVIDDAFQRHVKDDH